MGGWGRGGGGVVELTVIQILKNMQRRLATPWPMNNNGPPGNTALPVRNRAVEITTTLTTSYILKKLKKKKMRRRRGRTRTPALTAEGGRRTACPITTAK